MTPLHLLLSLAPLLTLTSAWVPLSAPVRFTATRNQAVPRILFAVKTEEELLPIVRDGIAEKDATDEWNACVAFLAQDMNIEEEEAEIYLASALEWRGWARVNSQLARKYMKPKLPNLERLQHAMTWLREGPLALTDATLLKEAIEKSPIAYLVDPEAAYQEAIETAPLQFQDPDAFQSLLQTDPSVLECSYNCVDDGCASECGNCWVSYEIKRGSEKTKLIGVEF